MCLVAFAVDASRRFPLVVASNRDEYFDRPAARLAWWTPTGGGPEILGGRDLKGGGTWMGLTQQGRFALVTNVRNPSDLDPGAPSRGEIVPLWLRGDLPMDRYWMQVGLSGYNGFNVLAADFRQGECFWGSNRERFPKRLERGVYGLSNASLDTPWPKVERLKQHMRSALREAETADALAERLFEALGDRTEIADEFLPHTGVSVEWERWLSPAFIRTPDGRYGTRCSTVVITERIRRRLVTHVIERSFTAAKGPGVALLRRSMLKHWPPLANGREETAAASVMVSGPAAAHATAARATKPA
ncbi:NRDE family protein [Aquabacterium sp. A7-Y]|uniref:NRDE family protein n=1 Tax=Aquabacterium sp. A7-Y TaxID=1349605 RepID=UPI00223E2FE5|nr:NRDE family protein [Aquabacterium sp. A7-Y]MCW7540621.1 NRDE family protein [Aquabacterium sp. A7-Y]